MKAVDGKAHGDMWQGLFDLNFFCGASSRERRLFLSSMMECCYHSNKNLTKTLSLS